MAFINNNKIISLGGIKRAYLNNTLIFQSLYKVEEEPKYDIDIEFYSANERGNSFYINGTKISTTDAYYKGRLKDLGFDKIESFSFNNSSLTKINAFPSISNVTTLYLTYQMCPQLTEIPDLDYPNGVNCGMMFYNTSISSLAKISPSTAQGMYGSCPNLTEVNVYHYLNNASDISIFIAGCSNLTEFSFGTSDITPTNLFNFFYGDSKLSKIYNINNVKLDNATNISGMFQGCSNLTDIANINFGSKPTSLLTNASNLFNGSGLDLTKLKQVNYPNLYNLFTNCTNLTNVSGLFANSQLGKDGWSSYNDNDKLGIFNNAPIENCSRLFQNTPIRYVSFEYSDLSTVTDCSEMFNGCYNLERVEFGALNFREDINYSGMFQGCSNLKEIQFWNTPSCTSVNILKAAIEEAGLTSQVRFNFSGGEPNCGTETQYDITAKFDVDSTNSQTQLCNSGLTTAFTEMYIDGEQVGVASGYAFSTPGEHTVHYILSDNTTLTSSISYGLFQGCVRMSSIELPDTLTSIGKQAFYGCTSLTEIVIPNSVITIGDSCFRGCTSLIKITIGSSVIKVGNPTSTAFAQPVFSGCTSLIEIVSLATTAPPLTKKTFSGVENNGGTLYVPQGSDYSTWKAILKTWTIQFI